jgi:hypothetical protein
MEISLPVMALPGMVGTTEAGPRMGWDQAHCQLIQNIWLIGSLESIDRPGDGSRCWK